MPSPQPCLYIIDDLGVSHIVDLKDATEIALSYCANDITKLSRPNDTFSKSLTLLGTDRTNLILAHSYRVDKVNRSVLRQKLKAVLMQEGFNLMGSPGVLEITDIIYDVTTATISYDCDFTAQSYNWRKPLEQLAFCDAGLGNHVFSETLVRNSWDRTGKNGTPYGYDYIGCTYFPVHYGWWMNQDEVSIFDLRPHVYVRWLLERAFDTLGYTLKGDYITSEDFNKRVIVFGRGTFGPSDVSILYQTFQVLPNTYGTSTAALPTYLEAAPAVREIWYSSTWTQPFTYEMRVIVTIEESMIDGSSGGIIRVSLYVDDVEVQYVCTVTTTGPFIIDWSGCVEKGQTIRVKVNPDLCVGSPNTFIILLQGVLIQFQPLSWVCYDGDTIELCETIDPALNFFSILKGLLHAAGLIPFTDEERKEVTLVKIASSYLTEPVEDITDKINCVQSPKQSIVTDCINYKLAYLPDTGDKALDVECTEFYPNEIFSLKLINDPLSECLTEFRNPTFAPMNSDGWQHRNEGGIHGVVTEDYGAGYNTYMIMDGFNTFNWSTDTWTQPYTCQVRVRLRIQSGLTATYHRWGIEVNGIVVADALYNKVDDLLLVWVGCLNQGDEMKFKIFEDLNVDLTPIHIEITNGNSNFDVNWRWIDFNDVADNAFFKPVFLTAQKNRPDQQQADEVSPLNIISHDIVPRMVFYEGLVEDADINWTGSGGIAWKFHDGSFQTTETQFPYAYFYDFYEGLRQSAAFNTITRKTVSPDVEGSSVAVASPGVARSDYGLLLDSLAEGIILRLWMRFTVADIMSLKFNVPKYLRGIGFGNGVFLLNRVKDWNPVTEMALCELIQMKRDRTFS